VRRAAKPSPAWLDSAERRPGRVELAHLQAEAEGGRCPSGRMRIYFICCPHSDGCCWPSVAPVGADEPWATASQTSRQAHRRRDPVSCSTKPQPTSQRFPGAHCCACRCCTNCVNMKQGARPGVSVLSCCTIILVCFLAGQNQSIVITVGTCGSPGTLAQPLHLDRCDVVDVAATVHPV
jgi:hypothetical protein